MILIWDTCALNEICRAIAHDITHNSPPETAPATRGEEFLEILDEIMAGFEARCDCSSHTSGHVFAIELDLATAHSKLRNQDELVESFCTQGSFVGDWQSILENRIAEQQVEEEEITALRAIIQPDPGQRDVSLIVAALKLSTQLRQECVIVTDDVALSERINELKRARREVFFLGKQYSTARITVKFSLQVLRELYVSCGIDHLLWESAVWSYKVHHNGHYGQAGPKHIQTVVTFIGQMEKDRAEKEAGCIAAELGPAFGVDNA